MLSISINGAWNRLGSALIDLAVFMFAMLIGSVIGQIIPPYWVLFNLLADPEIYLFVLLLGFYFFKDGATARSLGKRFSRLQVLDHKTGTVASPLQCVVRNFFLLLGPLELLFILVNPARRLGDLVAGTTVAPYDPAVVASSRPNRLGVVVSFVVSCAFVILYVDPYLSWASLKGQTFGFNYGYVESSLNKQSGANLEKLLNDKLGEDFCPKVVVHDKMEKSDKKHIYVLLTLRENILDDEQALKALGARVLDVLHERVKTATFKAELNVAYQPSPSETSMKILTIAD